MAVVVAAKPGCTTPDGGTVASTPNSTAEADKNNKWFVSKKKHDPMDDVHHGQILESFLGLNLHFPLTYTMEKELGHGSFGTVWAVRSVAHPEEQYAVKVINREKLKPKDSEAVFREVEILRDLQDLKNVVPIFDFIEEPRHLYVVLFYAKGGDLFGRLLQKKYFTEKDARDIAITLLETLDVMHTKHKIVHRDLKPENLLLADRESFDIYFADFGMARRVPEQGLTTRCGTPSFVAPEIVLGQSYKTGIDMWSLGCILFMMMGGYAPFAGDGSNNNIKVLFRRIRGGDYTFHDAQWQNVSIPAKRLISNLLRVNPKTRLTARQALESEWIEKLTDGALQKHDLTASLQTLKGAKRNTKLTLKGAMHAVRLAVSAGFWNSDASTFSQAKRIPNMAELTANAALPSKISFNDVYELKRQIQKGATATVWECMHRETEEVYAVKIVHRAGLTASDDNFILNEVAIMQSLAQYEKYVVQILDFYEEPKDFYLVMELMEGGDLLDRLLQKNRYTEKNARDLTRALLKAVQCMHSAGITHRDLKPQNILLTSKEDGAHIKVSDFGFAQRVHTPQSLTSRCGTPTYVAPEILKNVPHDERVDLWSVGVIVYLLLSGYPPFANESQKELFRKIRTGEFVFHREDWVNISDDAKTLVRGLLVVDPEQRWTADQALQCAWIQDPDDDLSTHDLKSSIESLRERRTRLRKNKNSKPVVWRNDDPTPVAAKLKLVISAGSLHGMDIPLPA